MSLAIFANGSAMALVGHKGSGIEIDQLSTALESKIGSTIIICTASGYKLVSIEDYLTGEYKFNEKGEFVKEQHCPMCNITISSFDAKHEEKGFLFYELKNSDSFKVSLNSRILKDRISSLNKNSQAPPQPVS